MQISLWFVDVFDVQWDDEPAPNDVINVPIEIITPVDVIRGGAKKYIVDFDCTDFGSPTLIGNIPSGSLIVNTVLEVSEAFDTGYVTIGTQTAQGVLMTVGESNLTFEGKYQRQNFMDVDSDMTLKLFPHGSPTAGVAKLIIFYIE